MNTASPDFMKPDHPCSPIGTLLPFPFDRTTLNFVISWPKFAREMPALRPAISTVHAQAPRPHHYLVAAFRPGGQNRLHAGEDVDGRHFRLLGPFGAHHDQGITGFQLAEIESRRALQHLLHVERLIARITSALASLRRRGVEG